jgi:hypothetical protein
MPYPDVLVHTAQVVAKVPGDPPSIEGDSDVAEVLGAPFPCCLFLSFPGEENRRGRQVKEPLVLLPGDQQIDHLARLRITAPEVTGPDPIEWQVQGVQPFGKPGYPLVGNQATLRRVED